MIPPPDAKPGLEYRSTTDIQVVCTADNVAPGGGMIPPPACLPKAKFNEFVRMCELTQVVG